MCIAEYVHWHDPIGMLIVDLGKIGEHMHLQHFVCVNSYVGVAWPNSCFMGALSSRLYCKSHCIYYLLHCMVIV